MLTGDEHMADLHSDIRSQLDEDALAWLDEALAEAARPSAAGSDPVPDDRQLPLPAWELRFASAGRHCRRLPNAHADASAQAPEATPGSRSRAGAGETGVGAPAARSGGTVGGAPVTGSGGAVGGVPVSGSGGAVGGAPGAEPGGTSGSDPVDAARVLLLHAARPDAGTVTRLYTHGTAAERRAVLLALPYLGLGADAVPLVEDALRANDTRLVAAAVGPYAAQYLPAHAWRHAVLKCLFTGVPVAAVGGLGRRARDDAELARMLTDYARERTAAGRPVPDDLHRVLALTTPSGSEES
ncbi:EboA domain-containing protein [Streptomyces sp. NPDC004647]|uniref:EboA domain-containing protein n=1 Tax=Streptomyces sp. NPDC004647 TaxID=3154671 RepID=UPI0033BFB2BD